MNSLRKLRNTIRRPKAHRNIQLYIYTPLPGNKLGYIIEYRQRHFSQVFYYKYKENADGTLTKYGYLINDSGINNNNNDSDENEGGGTGEHKKSGKRLWANKDKDCVFYQTVADKTQIDLERRWLNEIRARGRWEVPVTTDEELSNEYKEWEDVMQHNNKVFISDNIQRRRVAEVLSNVENCCGMELDLFNKEQSKTTVATNVEGRLRPNQLPPLTTVPTNQFMPRPSYESQKSGDDTLSASSIPQHIKNYITYTPPISPKTPPSTPIDASGAVSNNSLLNINVRQRQHHKQKSVSSVNNYDVGENNDKTIQNEKPRKLVHLTHPKFSKIPPQVRIFDPEDLLLFRNCRCDYCVVGDYNE
ncbi:16066_t:CDS:1 [Acaulospora morrowiae]|uniref:16066_t:CDS:1 n=1 Tax=Acaulospora morrowiae TaxID=94023 RepID=A0A9N9C088_9GLOM|nr:16066_t:CDS:1 [Acaulospora morrowiae]